MKRVDLSKQRFWATKIKINGPIVLISQDLRKKADSNLIEKMEQRYSRVLRFNSLAIQYFLIGDDYVK